MMGWIGIPEIMIALVVGAFYVAPLVLAVWVVVTLRRVRITLESIERLLRRSDG